MSNRHVRYLPEPKEDEMSFEDLIKTEKSIANDSYEDEGLNLWKAVSERS